jgi:hypothetical protein
VTVIPQNATPRLQDGGRPIAGNKAENPDIPAMVRTREAEWRVKLTSPVRPAHPIRPRWFQWRDEAAQFPRMNAAISPTASSSMPA